MRSAFPETLDIPDDETHIVPIDGKAIRGTRGKGKRAVHIVSAWSSKLSLVLGQTKVDKKSNEITAVPELLNAMGLKGCIITADAISCQKTIADACIANEADYLLAVKGNQKNLEQDIQNHIEAHWEAHPKDELSDHFHETSNRGHGRQEYRCCRVFRDIDRLRDHGSWKGLKQFGVVQADRTHWEVKNNLHWMLDIAFSEDACQTKNDNGAENLSTLRRMALNILQVDKTCKRSIKGKRKKAGWSNSYLAKLLKSFIMGAGA